MAISSVSSSNAQQLISNVQQSNAPVRAEREQDNDKDDGSTAATKSSASAPVVNTSGQVTGSTINVTA